jgi:hypothetical protein
MTDKSKNHDQKPSEPDAGGDHNGQDQIEAYDTPEAAPGAGA